MSILGRNKRQRPLHIRFRRGYQLGLLVAVVIGGGVWISTQHGLDVSQEATVRARVASGVRQDVASVSSALGGVEHAPGSPVPRSDLRRITMRLDQDWRTLSTDTTDMPEDVRLLLVGSHGLAVQMKLFIEGANAVADAPPAEPPRTVVADAGRYEDAAGEIVGRLGGVVASYEARADSSVNTIRGVSHAAYIVAIVFLVLLIVILLRPLERQLFDEHREFVEAGESHRVEAARQELAAHLSEGLDAAETESETMTLVTRAFGRVVNDSPVELLMADTSRTRLTQTAVHPDLGGPGCRVESPSQCPAIARGRSLYYDDSGAINACPQLQRDCGGPCSAVCIPLSFMGKSMGVIHATGDIGGDIGTATRDALTMVASQAAVRIGTLRSFAQIELQASTDLLTGLPNRRATEDRLERLTTGQESGSVVMADLDHFKALNDTYGHEAGDRALRLFADTMTEALRDEDWVGRWGGEEFVIVMPGLLAGPAKDVLDRVRSHLAEACVKAEAPTVKVSMGVVDTEAAGVPEDLVRLADETLLAAKTQGRDRVLVGPAMPGIDTEMLEGSQSG